MSNFKKILVFAATYNEVENINKLILLINNQTCQPDILIVDDNSHKKKKNVVQLMQKDLKNLFLINRSRKLGLDTAQKIAYDYALSNQYDILITMDADLSHDPNEIKNFIKHLDNFPFVIGSRYMKGGKCLMKKQRLVLSKFGNLMIRFFLKINCTEYTSSYRGFNLNKLENFNLNLVQTKGYSFFMGTIYEIAKKKFIIKEIPIIFSDRIKGYSKIPKLEIFRTLKNLFILSIKN